VTLHEVTGDALAAIVDFAYTGRIELSGATCLDVIQAANLLQVRAPARTRLGRVL
jgi:hypothetical protein